MTSSRRARWKTNMTCGLLLAVGQMRGASADDRVQSDSSQLFDLLVASCVLIVLMVIVQYQISLELLWAGPLLIIVIMLAMGVGLLVATGSLFFRDVRYIVEVFLTFAIFFTPVFYEVNMFAQNGHWLMLNPLAPLMEGFASILRGQTPNWPWLSYSLAFSVTAALTGYGLLKKAEPMFAETI